MGLQRGRRSIGTEGTAQTPQALTSTDPAHQRNYRTDVVPCLLFHVLLRDGYGFDSCQSQEAIRHRFMLPMDVDPLLGTGVR
jgi:hypothetical protein